MDSEETILMKIKKLRNRMHFFNLFNIYDAILEQNNRLIALEKRNEFIENRLMKME